MSKFYVYRYTNNKNGKMYFGKGKGTRHKSHLKSQRVTLLTRAIHKHGRESFNIEILFSELTQAEAFHLEVEMITRYRTNIQREYEPGIFGRGYNQTDGGDGTSGLIPWNKGIPLLEATRIKISKRLKGISWGNHSLETKMLMSRLKLGYAVKDSTKQLLSDLNKGKKLSDETKRRMSIAKKSQIPHNKGKKTGPRPVSDIEKITATKRAKSAAKTATLSEHISTMKMLLALGSTKKDVQRMFHISQQRFNELLSQS